MHEYERNSIGNQFQAQQSEKDRAVKYRDR